ncbi:MAG: ankyrin repeat domain-containing protein [Gammaproteobacteria bacterium]
MPLKLGQNAYKPAEDPTHWYDDPNDPGAIQRLYGNLAEPTPYYHYPVLIRDTRDELTRSDNYDEDKLFKIQFEEIIRKIKDLAHKLSVNIIGTNENDQEINIVDEFSKNILCGFNGITISKFATQADPTLFADIKEYVETILNVMLQDVTNAKGLLERFIQAISVCEGGAWADLKIMATEINPPKGLFGVLEKSRERLVNAIAQQHVSINSEHFDDEENQSIQTHVNVLMQKVFSLLGKIKALHINDVNIPNIVFSDEGKYKINFSSEREANLAFHYLIFLDDFVAFEREFEEKYEFHQMCLNVYDHINEQLNLIYHRYTKKITEAVRTTGLSPEAYLNSLRENAQDVIKNSLVDAKSDCITEISRLLISFDATNDAYQLVLNHDIVNPNKTLTLKSLEDRQFWCSVIATHSINVNKVIDGFKCETLPEQCETTYYLMSTDNKVIQWIETDSGEFVTPYAYIDKNPHVHTYLIQNVTSKAFLLSLQEAIVKYRIIMLEEDAFEADLKLIHERYFMSADFKLNDTTSPLYDAIQADNADEMKRLLSQKDIKPSLMAQNIIADIIGRSFWTMDPQFEMLELMIKACPDLRSALTKEEEACLIEWAIKRKKTELICLLINQSIHLNDVYRLVDLSPLNVLFPLLHVAAWGEFDDVADACLQRSDLDVNAQYDTAQGFPTALHIAAMCGNASLVKKLLAHKNINMLTNFCADNFSTPLDEAIRYGKLNCIELLLPSNPLLIKLNCYLHSAPIESLEFLTNRGADISSQLFYLHFGIPRPPHLTNKCYVDALTWAMLNEKNGLTTAIVKRFSQESFDLLLNHPLLLQLRTKYGLIELSRMAGIDQLSLKAYKLWAKSTILRMEEEINNPNRVFTNNDLTLTLRKIKALNDAIQGNDIDVIFNAIKLPCATAVTRYWKPALSSQKQATASIKTSYSS